MKTHDDIYRILEEIKDILIEGNINTIEIVDDVEKLPDTKIIKVIPLQDKRFKIKYRK